ncbi:sulfurtransferase TusA family protein [Chloroflexota bacterium]
MKADHSLDCMGLYCPMPIYKTGKAIEPLKIGEVLEVVADDKGIKLDMPAWCKTSGHEFVGVEEKGNEIRVYVKKTHD